MTFGCDDVGAAWTQGAALSSESLGARRRMQRAW
jgi:hypothetical protein